MSGLLPLLSFVYGKDFNTHTIKRYRLASRIVSCYFLFIKNVLHDGGVCLKDTHQGDGLADGWVW
jgi:hypothetical protein